MVAVGLHEHAVVESNWVFREIDVFFVLFYLGERETPVSRCAKFPVGWAYTFCFAFFDAGSEPH